MPKNPYYCGPVSDHFDGTRFFYPGHATDRSRLDFLKWQFGGGPRPAWPEEAPGVRDTPPQHVEGAALRVSFVGHASVLIQTEGVNILIDPVWAERASPLTRIGPKRVNQPGIALDDLPPLDAVLVTHAHYDHLDLATLSHLARERPCRVITPLGNDAIMRARDSSIRAEAYDWGDSVEITPGIAVHIEPSLHWSARNLRDRRMALWCAFVIDTPCGKIFHAGDTGYGDGQLFRDLFRKYRGFRLANLPIGAYEPRWFMKNQHVDPEEAVRIFEDLGAGYALAMHWGTFRLTDEAIDEPVKRLEVALERAGIAPERFQVKRPGEFWQVPQIVPEISPEVPPRL
jgi:L-ascorbate metabolism protein UlaG (beta-lactamase superfamily)